MQEKRCAICQIQYTPEHPHSITCKNPICKKRRRNIKLREEYQNRVLGVQIEKAKELLEKSGYVIMPKINNSYRIILEPYGIQI